jgi:hypothetical protein
VNDDRDGVKRPKITSLTSVRGYLSTIEKAAIHFIAAFCYYTAS